jgi:hypothetical protein
MSGIVELVELAQGLVGKSVQKVETTRRGIVVAARDGSHFRAGAKVILEFEGGYSGLYDERSIRHMLANKGRHLHNCE